VLLECILALSVSVVMRLLWPNRIPGALVATMMLPTLISPTIVGLMGRFYLNDQIGYASRILKALGWFGRDHAILATASGAWWTLALLDAWQWGPFTALLFWLALRIVPRRQLEAAQVDGVPWWSAMLFIRLPHVWPAIATIVIVRSFWAIRSFDVPMILTGGGPGTSTMMVTQFASRLTFSEQRHGVGAAHLILMELGVAVMVTVAVWFFKRRVALLRRSSEVGE
jgi:ABC-type sugar transport system permease subunit